MNFLIDNFFPTTKALAGVSVKLILLCGFLTSSISASPRKHISNEGQEVGNHYLRNLEARVWGAEASVISELQLEATKLIQKYPKSALAHYLLGQLYLKKFKNNPYEMQLLRQAAELGQQAIDLNPSLDYGYVLASQVLDIMGYTSNARKLIKPSLNSKIKPSWRTLYLNAKLDSADQDIDQVLKEFEKSMGIKNAQTEVIFPDMLALVEANFEGKALVERLEIIDRKYNHPLAKLNLAIVLAKMGRSSDAHKIYQSIKGSSPVAIEAKINDSILMHRELNLSQRALGVLQNLLIEERNLSHEQASVIKSNLARIHIDRSEYSAAEDLLYSAIIGSDDILGWISLSHSIYADKNSMHEFSSLMERVKLEIPGSGAVYALHGDVLSEKLKKHNDAIEAYQAAIILEPKKSQFYNGLGLAYYRKNDMKLALSTFSEATRIDPSDATARYNEACVLSLMGRSQEALSSLKEAISLNPQLQRSAQNDLDFNNISKLDQFKNIVGGNHSIGEISRN